MQLEGGGVGGGWDIEKAPEPTHYLSLQSQYPRCIRGPVLRSLSVVQNFSLHIDGHSTYSTYINVPNPPVLGESNPRSLSIHILEIGISRFRTAFSTPPPPRHRITPFQPCTVNFMRFLLYSSPKSAFLLSAFFFLQYSSCLVVCNFGKLNGNRAPSYISNFKLVTTQNCPGSMNSSRLREINLWTFSKMCHQCMCNV